MFKVKQILDCADRPMREGVTVIRTVYAADRNTNSFLVADSFGELTSIPIRGCIPYYEKEE